MIFLLHSPKVVGPNMNFYQTKSVLWHYPISASLLTIKFFSTTLGARPSLSFMVLICSWNSYTAFCDFHSVDWLKPCCATHYGEHFWRPCSRLHHSTKQFLGKEAGCEFSMVQIDKDFRLTALSLGIKRHNERSTIKIFGGKPDG